MADSYIKSYLACEQAYYGINAKSNCSDQAAQEAQKKYEDYLKELQGGKDGGDWQDLYYNIQHDQTIVDNLRYYEYNDDTTRNVYFNRDAKTYDSNSQLELPPVFDPHDLGPYDADSQDPPGHTANNFTRYFDSACKNGTFSNILNGLQANMSDDDYHNTLGNLSSPADQEKLCAIREKLQPLVQFFSALDKVAQAYASNPQNSANLTLDLPDGSVSITSAAFGSMLKDALGELNNLGN